jgi:lambda repressor-like predicted transcriptional regulator
MSCLSIERRAQIINMLVEGMSVRAVSRVADVSINTLTKLLKDVGAACNDFQSRTLNNLPCKRIECDEIWAFCYAKEKNVAPEDKGVLGYGDVHTWTALCAGTKLIASLMVGKRDADYAHEFMQDLAARRATDH